MKINKMLLAGVLVTSLAGAAFLLKPSAGPAPDFSLSLGSPAIKDKTSRRSGGGSAVASAGGGGGGGSPTAQVSDDIFISDDQTCHPSYSHCVPIAEDVDCQSGEEEGEFLVSGAVQILGKDVYLLDADKDGWGCKSRLDKSKKRQNLENEQFESGIDCFSQYCLTE